MEEMANSVAPGEFHGAGLPLGGCTGRGVPSSCPSPRSHGGRLLADCFGALAEGPRGLAPGSNPISHGLTPDDSGANLDGGLGGFSLVSWLFHGSGGLDVGSAAASAATRARRVRGPSSYAKGVPVAAGANLDAALGAGSLVCCEFQGAARLW